MAQFKGGVDTHGPKPPVFISYKQDIQDWVRLLKSKLEENGVQCWMDIGQMGGGDALYATIDAGIRAAKVVISCVTEGYSRSEPCKREVTLADALNKPIIPLRFDESAWPPPGQMSPIFATLVYINMAGQPGTIPEQNFQQLLAKVREKLQVSAPEAHEARREGGSRSSNGDEELKAKELIVLSQDVTGEYEVLGVALGLTFGQVDGFTNNYTLKSPAAKALEMLKFWSGQTQSTNKRETLANALEEETVGRRHLAQKVRNKTLSN